MKKNAFLTITTVFAYIPARSKLQRIGKFLLQQRENAVMDRAIAVGTAIALGITIVAVFSHFAPFNMDEFMHYHQIICKYYPHSGINIYREYCGAYDLDFLSTGIVLPLRSYGYTGSLPALYYYPLFFLWKSPLSARFLGYLFLLAQAGMLSLLFGISLWFTLTSLLIFFPYFYQHMVDTGPIGLHVSSIILLYWLFEKWCRTLQFRYPIVVGFTLAAGLWIKPSYFWLLPGIAMLLLLRVMQNPSILWHTGRFIRFLLQCALAALIALSITASIYISSNPLSPVGTSLFHHILGAATYSPLELLQRLPSLLVMQRLMSPFEATHRVFQVSAPSVFTHFYYFTTYLTLPLFLVCSLLLAPQRKGLLKAGFLYLLFAATIMIIARTRASGSMHHVVLSFPFLILSAYETYVAIRNWHGNERASVHLKRLAHAWCVLFIAFNIVVFAQFPYQKLNSHDDPSKIPVQHILTHPSLATRYLYVILDWGMYYYLGLYGHREQSILYMEPLRELRYIEELKQIAEREDRKILFIYNSAHPSSDMVMLQRAFTLLPCQKIPHNAVWQLLVEIDLEERNVCSLVTRNTSNET